jgi:hypothetical protein
MTAMSSARCRCPVVPFGETETNSTTEGNPVPTAGRTVLYKLNANDAKEINRRRRDAGAFTRKLGPADAGETGRTGHVLHSGNHVAEGDVLPAFKVADFGSTANLHVLLDGNDTHWATSRGEGDEPGQWSQAEEREPSPLLASRGPAAPVKPSVGRVVHYVSHGTPPGPDGAQAYSSECRAAIVTEVSEQHTSSEDVLTPLVALCVLNPTGMFFSPSVPYHEGDTGHDHTGAEVPAKSYQAGSWHWPERAEG